jgi:flagellar biosynthesis protein FliR
MAVNSLNLEDVLLHAMPLLLRIAGIMTFAPFFGGAAVSVRIKAAFTVVLTVLLYPIYRSDLTSGSPLSWVGVVCGETFLGLGMGLCLQFIVEAAQLAGQVAGFQFSFSLVNVIDPQSNVDTTVLSIFHQLITMMFFLHFDVHHWVLRGVVKSFSYVPVGTVVISGTLTTQLFHTAGAIFLVGVQIATPLLLATFLVDLAVGFLSKASPQMPAIFFSIPLKSLTGYVVLAVAVGLWPAFFEKQFLHALGWSEALLRLAH